MKHPDWVMKHKTKGTEIRKLGKYYYLYKIRSEYDKEKKRAKKITEKFLGKITEEGLIKPKHERIIDSRKNISVKEFGASQFIAKESKDIIQNLKEVFPDTWKEIFTFAAFRFFSSSPLKNVQNHYQSSYLSDIIPDAKVSPKTLSNILHTIGQQRDLIKKFLSKYIAQDECMAPRDSPGQVAGWKKVTDAVHKAGGKIFLQLWHVGRVSHPDFLGGELPVAPSALPVEGDVHTPLGKKKIETPRALLLNEIPGIIEQFRIGAQNAKAAGFDGVEIHGANGYLMDQFLKDGSNRRTDKYGGSLQNRARHGSGR